MWEAPLENSEIMQLEGANPSPNQQLELFQLSVWYSLALVCPFREHRCRRCKELPQQVSAEKSQASLFPGIMVERDHPGSHGPIKIG